MVENKNSVFVSVKEENLKGNELKLKVTQEHMKNINIVMEEEGSKEYENLLNALDINVKKI